MFDLQVYYEVDGYLRKTFILKEFKYEMRDNENSWCLVTTARHDLFKEIHWWKWFLAYWTFGSRCPSMALIKSYFTLVFRSRSTERNRKFEVRYYWYISHYKKILKSQFFFTVVVLNCWIFMNTYNLWQGAPFSYYNFS